nr:MAG TPA_asm: hypothetical protein [Caudoviricetes sp.]
MTVTVAVSRHRLPSPLNIAVTFAVGSHRYLSRCRFC